MSPKYEWFLSPKTMQIYAEKSLTELVGGTETVSYEEFLKNYVYFEDQDKVEEAKQKCFVEKHIFDFSFRIIDKRTGNLIHVKSTATPIWENDKLLAIYGYDEIIDIEITPQRKKIFRKANKSTKLDWSPNKNTEN
jgi:hypothetical protein